MLKRNSNFTLIELIVVVIVLGILAAIVIPNISSFSKEARETQYTADARNVQTALDLYTAKSDDLDGEALQKDAATGDLVTFEATSFLIGKNADGKNDFKVIGSQVDAYGKDVTAAAGAPKTAELALVDFDLIHPTHLRKIPKYVDRDVKVTGTGLEFNDYAKKPVAAAVLLDANGDSTAVLQFVSGDSDITAVDGAVTPVPTANVAIIR